MRMLAAETGARVVLEEFADNPFLPKFYADPKKYGFQLELSFLAERYRQLNSHLKQPELFSPTTIADYYFVKSLIFARVTLADDEFALYHRHAVVIVDTDALSAKDLEKAQYHTDNPFIC